MNKLIDCMVPNNFLGIKIPAGKCYGTCYCDKKKCPDGYDKKFPNITDNSTLSEEEKKFVKEAIDKGYPNKRCYEIAGNKCNIDKKKVKECVLAIDFFDKCPYNLEKCSSDHLEVFPNCKNNENMFCETILKNNFQGKRCSDMFDEKSDDYKKCSSFFKLQNNIKDMKEGYHNYSDIKNQIKVRNKLRKINDGINDEIDYYKKTYDTLVNSLQTKNRLITINNEENVKKSFYIQQIMSASFFILNMIIVIILNYVGKISTTKMYSILFTMMVISIFYIFFWQKIKTFPKHFVQKVDKSIQKLQVSTQEWVDDNCNCPDNYSPSGEQMNYKYGNSDDNNIFHNDGTNLYSDFI